MNRIRAMILTFGCPYARFFDRFMGEMIVDALAVEMPNTKQLISVWHWQVASKCMETFLRNILSLQCFFKQVFVLQSLRKTFNSRVPLVIKFMFYTWWRTTNCTDILFCFLLKMMKLVILFMFRNSCCLGVGLDRFENSV